MYAGLYPKCIDDTLAKMIIVVRELFNIWKEITTVRRAPSLWPEAMNMYKQSYYHHIVLWIISCELRTLRVCALIFAIYKRYLSRL